jgi:hypothetical protein
METNIQHKLAELIPRLRSILKYCLLKIHSSTVLKTLENMKPVAPIRGIGSFWFFLCGAERGSSVIRFLIAKIATSRVRK